ncbi:hypothetical protein EMCRGX_G010101 [Ephydatia muelleri]
MLASVSHTLGRGQKRELFYKFQTYSWIEHLLNIQLSACDTSTVKRQSSTFPVPLAKNAKKAEGSSK